MGNTATTDNIPHKDISHNTSCAKPSVERRWTGLIWVLLAAVVVAVSVLFR